MPKDNTPFDFSNPETLEQELAQMSEEAAEAAVAAVSTEKKPAKPRIIKVSWTADRVVAPGEVVTFDYEVPKGSGTRGIVVGIPVGEMTNDELKIEYRNANSVFYKTKKAGKGNLVHAEARLEACKAEMTKRGIQPTSHSNVVMDVNTLAELIKSGKIDLVALQAKLDEQPIE